MGEQFDVIIVGAGTMGMAAGYYLAKKGVNTLLIDSHDPPHDKGSHTGDTRIIRFAYGEGREYVPLALRSKELWDKLQEETEMPLFLQTGVLGFGPKGTTFIEEAIASASEHNLPLEVLDANDINQRWSGIKVPENYYGCFEPTSGVLFSANCIRAYREGALKHGATLVSHSPVTNIEIEDDSVTVHTAKETYIGKKLILSAGAWNGPLLSKLGIDVKLQPLRQTHGFFDADPELYNADTFPIYLTQTDTGTYYGFPRIDGSGMKAGRHDIGQELDETYNVVDYGKVEADEQDTRTFLDTFMPQASGKLMEGVTCLYTKTPDEHFIIDYHPEHMHVAIAGGFSGHGFKFASVIGEILSEMVTTGKSPYDLSLFSIKRPILK